MPCPSCGAAETRSRMMPGFWRCDAVVEIAPPVAAPALAGAAAAVTAERPRTRRCATVYPYSPAEDGVACRCGLPSVGECSECDRAVCEEHSDLWRGWRVCDRDLAKARMRARATAIEEERQAQAAAAAAEAERLHQRTTVLELSEEEALWLLYVPEPRTELEIRSAVHVLQRVPAGEFTELCIYVLDHSAPSAKSRQRGLRRVEGWPFAGPDYHDRSWFLSRKGDWYRTGSYGKAGADDSHKATKVRLDDTEKRAVIYEMSWQQQVDNGIA